jgi:serine/threonine-protein kinase
MRACPQCSTQCADDHQYCPSCGFPLGAIPQHSEDRLVGRTLPGGYLILDLISVGGMGRVYRAEQRVLGRTVAVKIIHPHLLSDENSALRFLTEARAASQLNHPNSVSVIDFGRTDDGQPYLVMEFLRGKDLARVAYEEGPLAFSRIVDVLRQTLHALGDAHDLGIIHRDLKPENVILEPLRRGGDFVKVVDFGLAKLKADTQSPGVTNPGIVCGTPDYMAPEQGRGDPIDGRSDLYAVGVILFQLLTGRLPFEAESPTQVVMMHLSLPVPDPRQVAPEREIPEQLVAVVNKALAKDADQRYQDAHEFSEALRVALAEAESVPPERRSSVPPMGWDGSDTIQCPACETVVPLSKFCGECGARLPITSITPEALTTPSLPLPLVGREDDLAWLEDRRQEARRRLAGARLVGEPGSGKTRLLRTFLEQARVAGDVVVTTRPDPHWAEVAYHSVRRAIVELAKLEEGDTSARHWSGASAFARHGLTEVMAPTPPKDDRTPAERRHAVAEALRWAMRRATELARPRRVILAIDELHRIDGPSRCAFADAVGEPPDCDVLVIAAHAPGVDVGWGADHAARVISGLPPSAVAQLLRASRPGEKLHTVGDAGGRGVLPLYVEQIVRFSLEGGKDPPTRIGDLISRRIEALEPKARRVLQALTVLGDLVQPMTLAELLRSPEEVEPGLEGLLRAGMVERRGEKVSPAHPLIREIALASIPAAVRRKLHARALRVSEDLGAPIEVLALHAYHAQASFEALLLLEQVADRATQRGDVGTSVLALRRGLELARQEISRGELDDPLHAVLIFSRKLGDSLARAGHFSDAEGVLREALDVAGPSGADRAHVLGSLARVAHGRKRDDEAMGYIEEAIEMATKSGAHDLLDVLSEARRAWASSA